jgi:hypothetical protein
LIPNTIQPNGVQTLEDIETLPMPGYPPVLSNPSLDLFESGNYAFLNS